MKLRDLRLRQGNRFDEQAFSRVDRLRTADRKPVKNQDLWQRLDELAAGHEIEWHWVPGHAGVPGNERVDRLANEAIDAMASH